MLELDGSSGGGQLVRTALSLSALSGEAVRMTGIRDGRPEPGLRPQHLAAVRALADITDAQVSDVSEGATSIDFRPGSVRPGRYEVSVGTAGSVPLLFDTVLPLATALDDVLTLRATGGTDVRWAPTLDYFRRIKLPILRRFGISVAVDVDRRGFYPVGGGSATLTVAPSSPRPIDLEVPELPVIARVYSAASSDLSGREVAERQSATAIEGLEAFDVDVVSETVEYAATASPGSVVTVRLDRGSSTGGADALGERGKSAESVAHEAVDRVADWIQTGATVDSHLADQLLVFLALVGGRATIPEVTAHVETSCALLERFGHRVRVDRTASPPVLMA